MNLFQPPHNVSRIETVNFTLRPLLDLQLPFSGHSSGAQRQHANLKHFIFDQLS